MSKPKPPASLTTVGKELWSAVVAKYDLRPDELAILHGACRAADMVARLEAAWADEGYPLETTGSMGQDIEHPKPKSIRAWQAALDGAMARLKLPEDATAAGESNQNRSAANSRWAQAHGAGA